jgi:4-amino-4-deoxy-L-arabinose transferase-like glycosyltransferase
VYLFAALERIQSNQKMKRYLPWLICFTILRGLTYMLITPPWQAPDETTHFQFMELLTQRSLAEIRSIVLTKADNEYMKLEQNILESMKKHRAWEYVGLPTPDPLPGGFWITPFFLGSTPKINRPPLYYLMGATILKLINPKGLETRLYVARLYSFMLSLGTVILSYLIGYLVFKDEMYALMTGAFVSFLPQFMVIGTSVNSDNLVNLLGSAFLLYAVFLLTDKKRDWHLILIPFFFLSFFISGKPGAILVPIGIFLFAFQVLTERSKESIFFLILSLLILILAIIFVENIIPGTILKAYSTSRTALLTFRSNWSTDVRIHHFFLLILFKSFWFVGGWMAVHWNRWIYTGIGILSIFSMLGLLITIMDRSGKKKENFSPPISILFPLAFSLLSALCTCLFYYGFVKGTFAQGRYLFVVLPAFGIFHIIGLKRVCPPSIIPYFPYVFMMFMVCLDIYSLLGCLFPYYHFR